MPGNALKLFEDAVPASETSPNEGRLDSWKEIAAYLNREVRIAMRWEKERGLPVHRIPGGRCQSPLAWLRTQTSCKFGLPPVESPLPPKMIILLVVGLYTAD